MSVRKVNYVLMVIVLVLIASALFGTLFARYKIDTSLKYYTNELGQHVVNSYPNLDFVKEGIDLTGINEDLSKINRTVAELNIILKPYANELEIPDFIYNYAVGYLTKDLQRRLVVVNAAGRTANAFADENNFLTVFSLFNGIRISIMRIVNIVVIVIVVILTIILALYLKNRISAIIRYKKAISDTSSQLPPQPQVQPQVQSQPQADTANEQDTQ